MYVSPLTLDVCTGWCCSGRVSTCSLGPMVSTWRLAAWAQRLQPVAPPWHRVGAPWHSASSGRCSETRCIGSSGSLWELTFGLCGQLPALRAGGVCQAACLWDLVPLFRLPEVSLPSRWQPQQRDDGVWGTVPDHLRGPVLPPRGWPQAVKSMLGTAPPPPPAQPRSTLAPGGRQGPRSEGSWNQAETAICPPLPFHLALPSGAPGR